MRLSADGILEDALQLASPNFDDRPEGMPVILVVVHAISLPPGEFGGDAIEALFTNTLRYSLHPYYEGLRGLRVSAHFLIRRDGTVIQFVPCDKRAWHAGNSSYAGRPNCNDYAVGIELEGTEDTPYTDPQYLALNSVIAAICARFPIEDIVGHSDIAPGRKTDPGISFDWSRVHAGQRRS
jgi:AmpD protein